MPLSIIRNNIVDMQVDAIVNTANPRPVIGSGVDTAVHDKAGPKLLEARKAIGNIARGSAAVTPAYNLDAKYVIHTVGPIWSDGEHEEVKTLSSCYESSLQLALKHKCESVAFPLISSGNYGFPKGLALQTAISTISSFLMEHEMMVYLVVFDKRAYSLSEKLFKDVESYIDDRLMDTLREIEYREEPYEYRRWIEERELIEQEEYEIRHRKNLIQSSRIDKMESIKMPSDLAGSAPGASLEDLIGRVGETFSEALIRMIDERGLKDPDVYKRANISKQHFSKIKNTKDYQPKKSTALAFAVALKLNLDETKDLIGKAGYLLTESSKFDIIVEYFIERNNYDIFEINEVLFAFTDQILGS